MLAAIRYKHLVLALRAPDARKALVQITTLKVGVYRFADLWAPEAVLGGKPVVIDPLELVEMPVQQLPQRGCRVVARTVQRPWLKAGSTHGPVS